MKKLNFCPYEFKEIDMDNLAYELVFPEDWSWEKVKNETVVGTGEKPYIAENDDRRDIHFRKDTTVDHIILLEAPKPGRKNGFRILIEYIERENAKLIEKIEKDFPATGLEDDLDEEIGYFSEMKDKKKELIHVSGKRSEEFQDKTGNIIMYAIPCCPHCHNRLPIGWDKAEDFGAIALMAPSGGGKTTFLLSMMNKNWRAFQRLGGYPDNRYKLNIVSAHWQYDTKDVTYQNMIKNSEEMCKKGGVCQDHTNRAYWIPPVFLSVEYYGHTMIVGLYDNAGEELSRMNTMNRPNLKMLLDKIYAGLYLFDPHDLNIVLPRRRRENIRQRLEECKLMTIEEQGMIQQNAQEGVTGRELQERIEILSDEKGDVSRALEVYDTYRSTLIQQGCQEQLEKMYFAGIIIKSDLLETSDEIRAREKYDVLFDRQSVNDMLDTDSMEMRSRLVQEMIREFRLFEPVDIDDFKRDFGEIDEKGQPTGRQAVSWHCISALGCDADTSEVHGCGGRLQGEYAPIRVAEPLLTCILKRIADNGWIEG